MNLEMVFSVAGMLAMAGWMMLLLSPFAPDLANKIAGWIIPLVLSVGYVVLAVFYSSWGEEGGYGSLAEVAKLFSNQHALLAGWIHYLAFDLLIGAWICRVARREAIRFWWVVPCLLLTFLFGPAGFLLFALLRWAAALGKARKAG